MRTPKVNNDSYFIIVSLSIKRLIMDPLSNHSIINGLIEKATTSTNIFIKLILI